MRSRYFIESEARLKTLKFTKVPPAVVDRILFFQLRHSCVLKKDKKGGLYVNRAALRAFYAQNKKRKLPITYELRWELACKQGWKCKMCKKKLKVTAQVDHVKPLGQGGADAVHNLQVLCCDCHAEKTRREAKQVHPPKDIKYFFPKST